MEEIGCDEFPYERWLRLMQQGQHSRVNGRHAGQPTIFLQVPVRERPREEGGEKRAQGKSYMRRPHVPNIAFVCYYKCAPFCLIKEAHKYLTFATVV